MGALFWRSKQPKTETCLSKGTGSAFEDGGLQGDGLRTVLATSVVFGRTCGAASTTLANEKQPKNMERVSKMNKKTASERSPSPRD